MKTQRETLQFVGRWAVSYDSPAMRRKAIREIEKNTSSEVMHFSNKGSYHIKELKGLRAVNQKAK